MDVNKVMIKNKGPFPCVKIHKSVRRHPHKEKKS